MTTEEINKLRKPTVVKKMDRFDRKYYGWGKKDIEKYRQEFYNQVAGCVVLVTVFALMALFLT